MTPLADRVRKRLRYLSNPVDPAAFFSVFFVLLVILTFSSTFLPLHGLRLQPAQVNLATLPGVEAPCLVLAIDSDGRFYFKDRVISQRDLEQELNALISNPQTAISLLILADRRASQERILEAYALARKHGIENIYLATRPELFLKSSSGP